MLDMAGTAFVDRIIEHLARVVREETELLNKNTIIDLAEYSIRKSQGLYSLSRALRKCEGQPLNPETAEKLDALRGLLEANRVALSRHLQAVREVAALLSDVIRKSESDGTYDMPAANGRSRE
jgi:hypothetical protein